MNNGGSKHSYIARDIPLRKSKSYEALLDQPCYQQLRRTEVTRTASTSTEDLHPLTTADKSTSTADLGCFIEQSLTSVSSELDSYGWVGSNYSDRQENLTDATKVKVLTQQIQALEKQSMNERRKFSSTQRYRPDPFLLDSGQRTNSVQKAPSSQSILGRYSLIEVMFSGIKILYNDHMPYHSKGELFYFVLFIYLFIYEDSVDGNTGRNNNRTRGPLQTLKLLWSALDNGEKQKKIRI